MNFKKWLNEISFVDPEDRIQSQEPDLLALRNKWKAPKELSSRELFDQLESMLWKHFGSRHLPFRISRYENQMELHTQNLSIFITPSSKSNLFDIAVNGEMGASEATQEETIGFINAIVAQEI